MANLKRGGLRNPSGNNQYETKEVKAQRCALTSDETPPMVSTKRAAALMKVGERTVDHAKRIIESNNQDVIKAVDAANFTLQALFDVTRKALPMRALERVAKRNGRVP
jgi:hypothetical protein